MGERRHQIQYAEMAVETGWRESSIIQLDVGDILEVTQNSAEVVGQLEKSGDIMVDGLGVGDVGDITLRDRWHLANAGVLVVVVSIDRNSGELMAGPDIMSRGFTDVDEEFLADARELVTTRLAGLPPESAKDPSTVKSDIRSGLAKFVNTRTRRRPVIIPIVMEV